MTLHATASHDDDVWGLQLLTEQGAFLVVPDDEEPRSALLRAAAEGVGLAPVVVTLGGAEHRAFLAFDLMRAAIELADREGPHRVTAFVVATLFGMREATARGELARWSLTMDERLAKLPGDVQAEVWSRLQGLLN